MNIGRTAFKVWLSASIVWIIAIGVMVNAGGFFPAHFQADFPLRADLEPWQKDWSTSGPLRKPLYDIIRSPSAGKLPLEFKWRGYGGEAWNQHIHVREMPQHDFPSGETLDLPAELTAADRDYVLKYFWDHKWQRWWQTLGGFAKMAAFVPLAAFALLWIWRRGSIAVSGKQPAPEPPRLPYSPAMERLRQVTLGVAATSVLFWLVIGHLNQRQDPQRLVDAASIMLAIMLPGLAALVMSLLRRGPRTAAVLAAFAVYLMLPELVTRIVPATWLPN